MKLISPNEGPVDRVIRILLGVVLLIIGYLWLSGIWEIAAYVLGGVSLATGLTGFCGIYKILGINTCPRK